MTTLRIKVNDGSEVKETPGGLCGFISWQRLVEQLRVAGAITKNETITYMTFSATHGGMTFHIKRTPIKETDNEA